ncbi:MAG: hypothetical protein AAF918_08685 [Pseudomonadota bacterium]
MSSVNQTPTRNTSTLLLDEGRLNAIRQSIEENDETFDFLTQRLERYVDGEITVNRAENILTPLALRIAIDGGYNRWNAYFKSTYLEAARSWDYKNRDGFRQHGADFAYAFAWTRELWTPEETREILGRFDVWMDFWSAYFRKTVDAGTLIPQDSDETTMLTEALYAYAKLVERPPLLTTLNIYKQEAVEILERAYIGRDGAMNGGFWPESPSYNANTPRFYLRWHTLYTDDGGLPVDPQFPEKHARGLIYSFLADFSGHVLFNDPLGIATTDRTFPSNNFRTVNMLANPMLATQGTQAHRALRWLLDRMPDPLNGEFWSATWQLIGEDNRGSEAASPEQLGWPLHYFSNGVGAFFARSSWDTDADQLFTWNMEPWQVDHLSAGALHFDLFADSKPITTYASNATPSQKVAPYNTLYIENIDNAQGFYPGTQAPTLRNAGRPVNLARYSDENVAVVAMDATELFNVYGYEQTADYARQVSRQIAVFWDGVMIVGDRVELDPTQLDDIDKPSPYTREVMRLQRFEVRPRDTDKGFVLARAHGKDHLFKQIVENGSRSEVIDEKTFYAAASENQMRAGHRQFQIRESVRSNDVSFLGVHLWGSPGLAAPDTSVLTDASGQTFGALVTTPESSYIAVFPMDPRIELKLPIELTSEQSLGTAEIAILGLARQGTYTVDVQDNRLSIVAGGPLQVQNGAVVYTNSSQP